MPQTSKKKKGGKKKGGKRTPGEREGHREGPGGGGGGGGGGDDNEMNGLVVNAGAGRTTILHHSKEVPPDDVFLHDMPSPKVVKAAQRIASFGNPHPAHPSNSEWACAPSQPPHACLVLPMHAWYSPCSCPTVSLL